MIKSKKGYILIFFCFLIYVCSYLGKYSFNANINLIINDFGVLNKEAGLISTFFFFAYGFGQIFNGIFCKYYNKRLVLTLSLIVSAILNVSFALIKNFAVLKYLWLINGFTLSFLWPTIILLIGEKLPSVSLKKAVFILSMTTPTGILITYGLSALFVSMGVYRLSFYVGAIILIALATIVFIFYKKITDVEKESSLENNKEEKKQSPNGGFIIKNLWIVFVFLSIIAMSNKFLDDGIVLWMPKILVDNFGKSDSLSIIVTVVFPIFGILASSVCIFTNKFIKDLLMMIGMFLILGLLFIFFIIKFGNVNWALTFTLFALMYFITSCVGGIISTMAPVYMRDTMNSGLLAGLLNGCCYIGSTISSYTIGSISDTSGWTGVFNLFSYIIIFEIVVVAVYIIIGFVFKRRNKNASLNK